MSSYNGLWTVRFASVAGESVQQESAGVVVLRDGRVLGGDTWSYFVGTYSEVDGVLRTRIDVTIHFTSGGDSIFGGPLRPYTLVGHMEPADQSDRLDAFLTVEGVEGASLVAVLNRVAEG